MGVLDILDWRRLVEQVLTSVLEEKSGILQTSLAALRVPLARIRHQALMTLAMMGEPSGVGVNVLIKSQSDRNAVLHALADLTQGSRRSASRALEASNIAKRRAAAIDLAMDPQEAGIERAATLLSDSDSVVRALARSSLLALGHTLGKPNQAAAALLSQALQPDPMLSTEAACALPTAGPLGVDCLKELLAKHELMPRCAAVTGLRYATQDQAVALLTECLADPDALMRVTAAESLGLHPLTLRPEWQTPVVDQLEQALHDPASRLHYSMARALALTGGDAPLTALRRCLTGSDPRVRFATAEALGDTLESSVAIAPGKGWFPTSERTGELTAPIQGMIRDLEVVARCDRAASRVAQRSLAAIDRCLVARSDSGLSFLPSDAVPFTTSSQGPGEPPPRYADVICYEEAKGQFGPRLPDAAVVHEDTWYLLEVAIRLVPIGIGAGTLDPRKGLRPIRQEGPVDILVVAQSNSLQIESRTGYVTLPPAGDSTKNAIFRIRAEHTNRTHKGIAELELRFYHHFNLLEYMTLKVPIGTAADKEQGLPIARLDLVRHSIDREYRDLDDFTPRLMNVHVTRRDGVYELNFALSGGGEGPRFALPTRTRMTPQDLEGYLANLRTRLEDLTQGSYVQKLRGSRGDFREAMQSLVKFGHGLWVDLFKDKLKSELAHFGKEIRKRPLEDGGLVQVSLDMTAEQFFFPWAFLFDGELPKPHEAPNPSGFWGYRYGIEQQLGVAQEAAQGPRQLTKPLRIDFMLWEQFPNASEQIALLQELGKNAGGNVVVSEPPIKDRDTFYGRLQPAASFDADVLYFYTHGHTRPLLTSAINPSVLALTALPADAAEEDLEALRAYRSRLASSLEDADESWIGLTHGRLYYRQLKDALEDLPAQPLVFLNMCESAQVTPSSSQSFVDLFLTRNARAVVGTECTMTIHFAHPFSRHFLTEVLKGKRIADALLSSRRYFLDRQNPLGLAYTLFGSGTLSFKPCMAADETKTQTHYGASRDDDA